MYLGLREKYGRYKEKFRSRAKNIVEGKTD